MPQAMATPQLLTVKAPYDGQVVGQVAYQTPDEVKKYLAEAYALSRRPKARLPIPQRLAILEKTQQLIGERFEEILLTAAREGGKPYADSKVEIERAIQGIQVAMDHLRVMAGKEIPMGLTPSSLGRWAFTHREPVGVVLAISAFNHPFNLIIHQVIPAVAVGCPVLVKPARQTPLSCENLIRCLRDAGLPPEWCRMIVCDHDTTEEVVRDSRLAYFSFIGSAEVGWKLRSKLAPGVTSALEHGGAAPVILHEDADLEDALPLIAKGGFYHAGQVCVSVQRVYAHQSLAKKAAEQLAALGSKMVVGDPSSPTTQVGPLVHPNEVSRVNEWVQEAVQSGAQLLCGGKSLTPSCYAPTVLFNPPEAVRASKQEIFGPVICVYPYKTLDEALERANQLPFTFQSAVFTKSLDVALRSIRELDATAVLVNDHTAFRVDWMPFGGRRQSGAGVGGIPSTMKEMTYERLAVIRSPALL